jgi:hypothetical protein
MEVDRDTLYRQLVDRARGTWLKHQEGAEGIISKALLELVEEYYPDDPEKQKDLLYTLYKIRKKVYEAEGKCDEEVILEIARRYGVEGAIRRIMKKVGEVKL